MVWHPKPAGPKDLRQMFHWVYRELKSVGEAIGPIDGEVPPPNQGHTHDHSLLVNVTADQHHNEMHDHSDGDPSGTISHVDIKNRSASFCHPTQAITGLDADQTAQDEATALVQTNLDAHEGDTGNPHGVQHSQLGGITTDDHHDKEHLLYGPDHTDVDTTNALEAGSTLVQTADGKFHGLNLFSVAAYGGVNRSAPVAFNVTTGWTTLPLDQGLLANPRGITQVPGSNAIRLDYSGVYKLEIGGIIQGHNSSNSGRTFFVRLYNNTEGAPVSQDLAIGVGRNTEDTNFSFGTLFEVGGAAIGDDIIVQIGNGDAITGGTLTGGQLATFMIGEWRG